MNKAACPLEEKARQSFAAGGGDPDLVRHAVRCPVCRDVLAVSDWMLRFRDLTLEQLEVEEPLPAPGALWDLARAGRTLDLKAARKALKPIEFWRKISWVIAAAGGSALVLLEFNKIKSFLASIPGFDAIAEAMRKTAEAGAASPVQQLVLPATLGLVGILLLILVTSFRRPASG